MSGIRDLIKGLENLIKMFRGNTDSGVCHFNSQHVRMFHACNFEFHTQGDSAGVGIFYRVAYKVIQYL